jgi:hypothetical protein
MNEFLLLMILGALGGFMRHVVSMKNKVVLPHYHSYEGYLDLGFLGNAAGGAIFGYLTPVGLVTMIHAFFPLFPLSMGRPVTALFAGAGMVDVFENFMERVFKALN